MFNRIPSAAMPAALLLFGGAVLLAAPALTTIDDTLLKANGERFSGVVFVEWKTFEAAGTGSVPQQSVTVRVTEGVLRVALIPTTTAATSAYYQVRYNSDGKTDFTEFWAVPPSLTPLRIRDVRIPGPFAATKPVPPVNVAILITDIAGLRDELDSRVLKGSGLTPGRLAVVGPGGALETVTGEETDCVRVDGTSGPCGAGGTIFIDAEIPFGAVDGSNAVFELAYDPAPPASVLLYRNGLRQSQGRDFTLEGKQIRMAESALPAGSDVLQVYYRARGTLALNLPVFVDSEVPMGELNGTNGIFRLAASPNPTESLQLFRNGLLLKSGLDFDLSGGMITYRPGAIPEVGDTILATYRY